MRHSTCIRSVQLQLIKSLGNTSTTSASMTARESSIGLSSLDSAQLKVVKNPLNQAVVCKAGPGTGKTKVLAYCIAYLINENRVTPESIVAFTFTEQAAKDMKDLIKSILSPSEVPAGMKVSTFRRFCIDVLRTDGAPYLKQITGSARLNSKFGFFTANAGKKLLRGLVGDKYSKENLDWDLLLDVVLKTRTAQSR